MLPVAILAGGLATRLRPITETVPKSMVEVSGRPFISWQLEDLKSQGAEHVVLCIAHLGELVRQYVGDGARFGLKVEYSLDGKTLMGTGGAIRNALPLLGEAFFVFYGDSYLPIDFNEVERAYFASGKPALMTVLENRDKWDRSNVLFEGGAIVEYNKRVPRAGMAHIDYGLSILRASVVSGFPAQGAFDLADLYHQLSLSGKLAGHQVMERFYEIGSHAGLAQTSDFLSTRIRT